MIDCILTLDYEIYGNGTGSLRDLVYEPAEKLRQISNRWKVPLVVFVEAVELQKIEAAAHDPVIPLIHTQLQELYRSGCEIALHIHPQWCNASNEAGQWILDFSEYNLCTLSPPRIADIVQGSIDYLRHALNQPRFTPTSFRAGNWLLQPTGNIAPVLARSGIRVDSSVFKGGLQHHYHLDYRAALRNGYCWRFDGNVNHVDPHGSLTEIPIYVEMVPFWRMATTKRLAAGNGILSGATIPRLQRVRDLLRFRYPRKLDFCRMTLFEMTSMVDRVVAQDRADSGTYRPLVAIGHTKDLEDVQAVDHFLSFLHARNIPVSTLQSAYDRLTQQQLTTKASSPHTT